MQIHTSHSQLSQPANQRWPGSQPASQAASQPANQPAVQRGTGSCQKRLAALERVVRETALCVTFLGACVQNMQWSQYFRGLRTRKCQYFVGPVAKNAVVSNRFGPSFPSRVHTFFCHGTVACFLHTCNGFSMIVTHTRGATSDAMLQNHCFHTGFVRKMESLAHFGLAVCGGLKARLVSALLSIALKPPRGSNSLAEPSLLAL